MIFLGPSLFTQYTNIDRYSEDKLRDLGHIEQDIVVGDDKNKELNYCLQELQVRKKS